LSAGKDSGFYFDDIRILNYITITIFKTLSADLIINVGTVPFTPSGKSTEGCMKKLLMASLLATSVTTLAEEKIYELEFETDSNWTSIEIRDDAVFVNAPAGQSMNVTAKDGLRSYTISPKKIHLRSRTRGLVNMNLFVKSKNNVLGLVICKGSPSSYTWIKSEQSKQKNDLKKKDHCEQAALVLNLF